MIIDVYAVSMHKYKEKVINRKVRNTVFFYSEQHCKNNVIIQNLNFIVFLQFTEFVKIFTLFLKDGQKSLNYRKWGNFTRKNGKTCNFTGKILLLFIAVTPAATKYYLLQFKNCEIIEKCIYYVSLHPVILQGKLLFYGI